MNKRLLCGEWITEEAYDVYMTCKKCFKIKDGVVDCKMKNWGSVYCEFYCTRCLPK